jgi:hypothetical protein
LPQFSRELSIPVPLAKVLEYLGKYVHRDQNIITTYTMQPGTMNALITRGFVDGSSTYPVLYSVGTGLAYDSMIQSASNGELCADRTAASWPSISVAAWCQQRLFLVSNALRSLDIPVVPLDQIPEYAPSIDAYACRGKDRVSGNVLIGRVFAVTPIHDEDVATIFSEGRSLTILGPWVSKTMNWPMFDLVLAYANIPLEFYLACGFMFFMSTQHEFKAGPVKKVYKLYGKAEVTTFAWAPKIIGEQAIRTCLVESYKQFQAKIPGFNDVQGASGWKMLYALTVLFLTNLHHRIELSSPITNLALPLNGNPYWASTAFHNDGIADGMYLPAIMSEFISSCGVVVSEGAMVVPRLFLSQASPTNTWGSPTFAGNLIAMSWRKLNYTNGDGFMFPFPFAGTTTVAPNFNTGNFIWDSTYDAPYFTLPAGIAYSVQIPSTTLSAFVKGYKSMLGQQYYQNISIAMTGRSVMYTKPFGKPSQMLSVLEIPTGGNQIVVVSPADGSLSADVPCDGKKLGTAISSGPLYFFYSTTAVVSSSLVLDRHELMEAILLCADRVGDVGLAVPTLAYNCRITGADSLALTSSVVEITMQPGQNNGESVPDPVRLPNGQLVPVRSVEAKTNTPSIWDTAVHRVGSDIIEGGAGIAAGLACDAIPFIGELVSPLCASGAASLVSTFLSRSSTYATGIENKSAGVDYKARIAAVKQGVQNVGKAVGAATDAIQHTSNALTKVAANSALGLYARGAAMARII